MLKIECPGCNEWVSLPFDIGINETTCPRCSGVIPLKDVYVSAGPYTIHRDVLIKNMYRYKKLLAEAEKEFDEVGGRKDARDRDVTARSVKLFITHMKEMLSGCRGSTRHPLSEEISAELKINNRTFSGQVVNISVSGLCLDASGSPALDLTDELEITLSCGDDNKITVAGRVAWSDRQGYLGVRFTGVSPEAREAIEACITEKSVLMKPVK